MTNYQDTCTEGNMLAALLESRVPEIWECLWAGCSGPFRKRIARDSGSEDLAENVFWEAVRALAERAKSGTVSLTSSVCAYFHGFMKNYWRKLRERSAKNRPDLSLDGLDDLLGDPDETPLVALMKAERLDALHTCIKEVELLDDKYPIILYAYFEGKKDEEIMGQIGYSSRTGVSVARNRCFLKLKEVAERRFPGLFSHGVLSF